MQKNSKRGQLTLFIIIGILLLFGIFFYLISEKKQNRSDEAIKRGVELEPERLNEYIRSCLLQVSKPFIYNLSYNGGFLNISQARGRLYHNITYYYHCDYGISQDSASQSINQNKGCVNKLITRQFMESELNREIAKALDKCVNLTVFKSYNYEKQFPKIYSVIGVDKVIINVHYPKPLKIFKNDFTIYSTDQSITIPVKLGLLHDLATKILNSEITKHYFDVDEAMRVLKNLKIYTAKPYPDKLYYLELFDPSIKQTLVFKFGLEGFDYAESRGLLNTPIKENLYPFCIIKKEGCLANVKPVDCTLIGGISKQTPSTKDCNDPSEVLRDFYNTSAYKIKLCKDHICKNCLNGLQHGQSKCIYDGITGKGFDYVGSRHYKMFCYDGEIIYDACTDYREQICVEQADQKIQTRALCRPNRWEDCAMQTNKADCLNGNLRDCYWSESLANTTPQEIYQKTGVQIESAETFNINIKKVCHPAVPPGFKFWKGFQTNKICSMASEHRGCDGFQCPSLLNDKENLNCGYQGDCGIKRNFVDELGNNKSFYTTNKIDKKITITREGLAYLPKGFIYPYQNKLNLPFSALNRSQNLYSKDLYENSEGTISAINKAIADFFANLPKNRCHYCPKSIKIGHKKKKCVKGCHYDEITEFGFVCKVWKPPETGDCSLCTSLFGKTCSEYRCKSLGENCGFEYTAGGFEKCFDISQNNDHIPPIPVFDKVYGNYSHIIPGLMWMQQPINLICSKKPCNGEDDSGLQPYQEISIHINLSKPGICRPSLLNFLNYDQIPDTFSKPSREIFSSDYNYTFTTIPIKEVKKLIKRILNLDPDFIQQSFKNYKTKTLDEINQTINELINIKAQVGSHLTDIDFDGSIQDMKDLRNMFIDLFNSVDEVIQKYKPAYNILTDGLTNNNIITFIKCKDRFKNYNDQDLIIAYHVSPDKTPPKMLAVFPKNNTIVYNKFNLTIYLNEPSTCNYEILNTDIKGYMDCWNEYNFLSDDGYKCTTNLSIYNLDTFFKIKIDCGDNPLIIHRYGIKFKQGNNIKLTYTPKSYSNDLDINAILQATGQQPIQAYSNDSNTLTINDVDLLDVNDSPVFEVPATKISLRINPGNNDYYICSLTDKNFDYNYIVRNLFYEPSIFKNMPNVQGYHSIEFQPDLNKKYQIICEEKLTEARNYATFILNYGH